MPSVISDKGLRSDMAEYIEQPPFLVHTALLYDSISFAPWKHSLTSRPFFEGMQDHRYQ